MLVATATVLYLEHFIALGGLILPLPSHSQSEVLAGAVSEQPGSPSRE